MRLGCIFSGPSVLGLSAIVVMFLGAPERLERPALDGMTVPS